MQEVRFKDCYPPEPAAKTSAAADRKFGRFDDDVPVRFNPRYIGATPQMSSERHLDEETILIELKIQEENKYSNYVKMLLYRPNRETRASQKITMKTM
jgi:hypothetical protein